MDLHNKQQKPVTWSRVIMNQEVTKLLNGIGFQQQHCLEISGTNWADFGFASYRSVAYPEHDICVSALSDSFDLIIAEQVFEHLLYPYRAGKNVLSMLKPQGYFLISVPFLVKVHDYPIDCTRWTEMGLKHFLNECGFPLEKIQTGSWGNRACIVANFEHWVMYEPTQHSLENEAGFPYHVWALAHL